MLCMVANLVEKNDPEATRITASAQGSALPDPETGIEILGSLINVVEICVESIGTTSWNRFINPRQATGKIRSIFGDGNVSFVTDL